MKGIKFPQDELRHKWMIEWWYFNGHLKDKSGNKYAFMHALFKADFRKTGDAFLKRVPMGDVYFSHSIITDIKKGKSYSSTNPVVLVSKDSFTRKQLFINYINPMIFGGYVNCAIEKRGKFSYRLKTEQVDLEMDSQKKPIFEGGRGFINFGLSKTYYYSLPRLKAEGRIWLNGKKIKVGGISWMDHQWGDIRDVKNSWNWMSVQLENKTDIVCFEYKERGHRKVMADISYPNGRQETIKNVVLTPTEEWKSPKTKVSYPIGWKIEMPSKGIVLFAKAPSKRQEIVSGAFNYWEGPLEIKGFFRKKKVRGMGFLEVFGKPCPFCRISIMKEILARIVKEGKKKSGKKFFI